MWIADGRKFEEDLRMKIGAERKVGAGIGRLRKGTNGMGVRNARKMYIACRRTTMDYGNKVL